jgi:colicin import membrane protein
MRWQPTAPGARHGHQRPASSAAQGPKAKPDARRQAELAAERQRQQEAAAAAQRQAQRQAERQAELEAELEAARQKKALEERIAAAEAQRRTEEERGRMASATPLNADGRAAFVRAVQQALKQGGCYDGSANGRSNETTQDALDAFSRAANRGRGKAKPARIELAKATASDFEVWLRDAGEVKGAVCTPTPILPKPRVAKPLRERDEPAQSRRAERRIAEPRQREPSSSETKFCWGPRNELSVCR